MLIFVYIISVQNWEQIYLIVESFRQIYFNILSCIVLQKRVVPLDRLDVGIKNRERKEKWILDIPFMHFKGKESILKNQLFSWNFPRIGTGSPLCQNN